MYVKNDCLYVFSYYLLENETSRKREKEQEPETEREQ